MNEGCKETYLTVKEVAKYLNVSEPSIRRHVLNNEIPFCKIMGSVRFRLSEVETWVETQKKRNRVNVKAGMEGDLFSETELLDSSKEGLKTESSQEITRTDEGVYEPNAVQHTPEECFPETHVEGGVPEGGQK